MLKRTLSVLTGATLLCATPFVTAVAQSATPAGVEVGSGAALTVTEGTAKPGTQTGAGLKAGMLNLVAEARAGRVRPSSRPQGQPVQNNSLSKGRKIAIGVGAAAAVIILMIAISRGDSADRFNAPPCPPGQLCL